MHIGGGEGDAVHTDISTVILVRAIIAPLLVIHR